jgi:uncharacterized damage-inducible protein DinB
VTTATRSHRPPAAVLALAATLRQLAAVVAALSDEQYRQKPVGVVSASAGGHVRHSLDHVAALLAGVPTGSVDYDRRQRGTAVETDRAAALDALGRLEQQLLASPLAPEHRPLRLAVTVSSAVPPAEVHTTVGRELAFVLSHTVHHNALIAVIAATLDVHVPERFGYAPSTIAYLEQAVCVR